MYVYVIWLIFYQPFTIYYIIKKNKTSEIIFMYQNPTQLDSYNKYPATSQGTLIANWFEQRQIREHEGQGRALNKTHIPKLHKQIYVEEVKRPDNYQEDNTAYRLMGYENQRQSGQTQNYFYGKGTNKAESFDKIGKKQKLLQEMYLNQIHTQLKEKKQKQDEEAKKREFQTTNNFIYTKHPINENVIGRRVMKDQNGNIVPFENIDEDLKTDKGFYERKQISTDEELKKLLNLGEHYSKQQPITFWREKLEDGNFYMSKTNGVGQQFNKNNEFLKTFKHYKHYKD